MLSLAGLLQLASLVTGLIPVHSALIQTSLLPFHAIITNFQPELIINDDEHFFTLISSRRPPPPNLTISAAVPSYLPKRPVATDLKAKDHLAIWHVAIPEE